ncbi:MAG: cytochrome c3 family protein [Bacillota bacterium]
MGRAKPVFIIILSFFCMVTPAATAFAWTHGQFSATTDACAGCHIAHAAPYPKLLKSGPTQTDFCYLCHGQGTTGAPYDIQYGKIVAGGTSYSSNAGGFERQWTGPGENDYQDITSRHTVWGYLPDALNLAGAWSGEGAKQFTIPGGTDTLTGNGLTCGSCHDPHAGGKTPSTVSWTPPGSGASYNVANAVKGNPRLLRTTIFGKTVDSVIFTMESVDTFTYLGVQSGVYRVTEYVYGSSSWCGTCHSRLDTGTAGDRIAGQGHAGQYLGMWRHPMDVHATPPSSAGMGDVTVDTGTPLEIWTSGFNGLPDKVSCLTCHRAHSTTAQMEDWATDWPRDDGGRGDTSALLRMNNRGTCHNCHGAGQYNSWKDPRITCSACHPDTDSSHNGDGGVDCSFCHR